MTATIDVCTTFQRSGSPPSRPAQPRTGDAPPRLREKSRMHRAL